MADDRELTTTDGALFIGATVAATLAGLWVFDRILRPSDEADVTAFALKAADEELVLKQRLDAHRKEANAAARKLVLDAAVPGLGLYTQSKFLNEHGDLLQKLYDVVDPEAMPDLAGAVKRLRYAHDHIDDLGPEVFTRATVDLWRHAGAPCRNVGISKEKLIDAVLVGDPDRKKVAINLSAACGGLDDAANEIALHAMVAGPARLQGVGFQRFYAPRGADLEGIDLSYQDLRGAQFEKAKLEGANFEGANLEGANFNEADLDNVNFKNANLKNATLWNARMSSATLTHANLTGAKLGGAYMAYVHAFKATFDDADLSQVKARELQAAMASFANAKLDHADFSEANLDSTNLSGVNMSHSKLENATADRANLAGAQLHKANLAYVKLDRTNMSYADLSEASLYRTSLNEADLRGARFNKTVMTRAFMLNAELQGADFHGAVFDGTEYLTDAYRNDDDPPIPGWRLRDGQLEPASEPRS